jgi:hypothetical protein
MFSVVSGLYSLKLVANLPVLTTKNTFRHYKCPLWGKIAIIELYTLNHTPFSPIFSLEVLRDGSG